MSGGSPAGDGIPAQHSSQAPWESEHTSNESSQQSSRQQSRRPDRQTQRPPHKVTFSIADDQAESNPHRPVDPSHTHAESTVPEIHFSTPDVVTDTPSSSSWTGRTHAAAAYAQSRASRLADALSSGERRNKTPSGSNTPLMAPPQGQFNPSLVKPGHGLEILTRGLQFTHLQIYPPRKDPLTTGLSMSATFLWNHSTRTKGHIPFTMTLPMMNLTSRNPKH